MNKQIYFF